MQPSKLYEDALSALNIPFEYDETASRLLALSQAANASDTLLLSKIQGYAASVRRWNSVDPCGGLEEECSDDVASRERDIRSYCEQKLSDDVVPKNGGTTMKFSDIPQFTRTNGYQVNVSLRHLHDTLDDYLTNSHLELNPDFQRGHVWTETQQVKFIEFLMRGGVSSRTIYFNHPNWQNDPMNGWFVCVDGLQRITACERFMNNEIPIFGGHYYKDFEDRIPISVGLIFVVNDLKTRKEVLQWYLELNDGGTVHSEEELNRVQGLLEAES